MVRQGEVKGNFGDGLEEGKEILVVFSRACDAEDECSVGERTRGRAKDAS